MVNNLRRCIVSGCRELRVRKEPQLGSDVLTKVPYSGELLVDLESSVNEYYKVYTATGIEGYCMKQYITLLRNED